LLRYLSDQFNKEIEGGDTYPMVEGMPFEQFANYWFQNFAGIMLLGNISSAEEVVEGKDWSKECLGTFYIKPNYPGRSSHICNAGFIVTDAARNRGVGRLMGESYLDWAPKLGYSYSVFNLVYETNVASCKIWDALGFKRIGRVKGAGNLKSYPDRLIDAIIYGRDLGGDANSGEELVSEERFDKIKFYLKYGRYPNGADRAEKSRLRSAATHYKLLEGDVLMLKDKEVISDPQRQFEIARNVHNLAHAGINKSTATIAEKYHWSRIKETVSDVIRNCSECKELGKMSSAQPVPGATLKRALSSNPGPPSKRASPSPSASGPGDSSASLSSSRLPLQESTTLPTFGLHPSHYVDAEMDMLSSSSHTLQPHQQPLLQHSQPNIYQPIDPQIISHHNDHTSFFHSHDSSPDNHINQDDDNTFQALLSATSPDDHIPDHDSSHHQSLPGPDTPHPHPLEHRGQNLSHRQPQDEEIPHGEQDIGHRDLEMLLSQTDEEQAGDGGEDIHEQLASDDGTERLGRKIDWLGTVVSLRGNSGNSSNGAGDDLGMLHDDDGRE
jgi:GNAT superfamily N-acetyltransferase